MHQRHHGFISIALCVISSFALLSSLLMTVTASSSNPIMMKHIVFSDVDGTLAHYPKHLQHGASDETDSELIYLPPSKTGTRGVLSKRTFELCDSLRHGTSANDFRETPLVLISGMRTTTLFQRLPYLPRADAYVSESGGRIFYPVPIDDSNENLPHGAVENLVVKPFLRSHDDCTQFTLIEDLEWKKKISQTNAAGPDEFNKHTQLDQRIGKLWEYASSLMERGYVLDTQGYATAFRINRKMQSGQILLNFDAFINNCRNNVPDELRCSTNLGCVDIYPVMSGKKKCCEYLIQRFLGKDSELKMCAFCMCDDDNDIEMALSCKTAFLPSVTSTSIREKLESQKSDDRSPQHGKLVVTEDVDRGIVGTVATERALEMILERL